MNTSSQRLGEQADERPSRAEGDGFLELLGVSKSFRSTVAVENIDLSLAEGEFFSILGASGCGKTTTLRMIAGFERPTNGRILLDERDITDLPPDKRPVNTVFQSYALFSHLDVAHNVAFGLREDRVPKKERMQRMHEALALVQLEGFESRHPNELSGGQQQRVALARAVVQRPRVLLLDEPLGALDLKLRKAMQIELKTLQQQLGMTFVYVTHDQEEALTMSDRLAVMRDGQLDQLGSPEQIYDRPASRYVAEFIGASNCLLVKVLAESDGFFECATENGWRGLVPKVDSIAPGRHAYAVIRPERCRLEPVGDSTGLTGQVTEILFKGMHRSYLIQLTDGTAVTVVEPHRTSDSESYSVGDPVRIAWSDQDTWLVPA